MATSSEKTPLVLSTCLAIVGVGLIVASFASDHWISSHPKYMSTNSTKPKNGSTESQSASITFGLFSGYKSINYGLGDRPSSLKIKCDTGENVCAYIGKGEKYDELDGLIAQMKNRTEGSRPVEYFGLFDFRLYAVTLVMLSIAMVWGVVTIGFSIFNIFGRPIETITGRQGLYLWNLLALIFLVTATGIYLGLYFSQLKENILAVRDKDAGFSSKDQTDLDYSFFCVIAAACLFFINIVLLAIFNRGCSCNYSSTGVKEVDNGMILY